MGMYTDAMEARAYELDPADDNYREELLKQAGLFRSQAEVLEELVIWDGYRGDPSDAEAKFQYCRARFKEKAVAEPRNLKDYFLGTKHFDRDKKTPFRFCFAFELNPEETEEFFRRCCLGRGVDYHSVRDVIYAFGIRNKLSWKQVCEIEEEWDRICSMHTETGSEGAGASTEFPAGAAAPAANTDIGYFTGALRDLAGKLQTKEELLLFLQVNKAAFSKNNVTASERIRMLWEIITDPMQGLLIREDRELLIHDDSEKKRRIGKRWSEEAALKQMLGISGCRCRNPRSLTEFFRNNRLLHPLAADCFPNRNALRAILSGRRVSYESVRKLLVLLLFYRFWVELALKRKDSGFRAKAGDAERCMEQLDRYLLDSGYPTLYYGNPYDWLFLFAMLDDYPLETLRGFMGELCDCLQEENA